MKKFFIYTLLVAFIATISFTGCKETETGGEEAVAFETLTTYLSQNSMDLPDVLTSWIVSRPADLAGVPAFIGTYDIFDLRSAADYGAGHIEGAINVTLGNLLTSAQSTSKPILCVCYTGQTAGHACVALRLSDYSDAVVLKWGMSGWKADLSSKWTDNSGPVNGVVGVEHANWSTTGTKSVSSFGSPSISTSATNGASILAERVDAMLAGGFKGTGSATVLDNPSNYLINNYWAQTDVDHYGHINGAYRVNPLTIAGGEINNLDPSKQICTYCWTGQTSSMITAYLNVLGFNATSLKYGANSMIYSELESHKFVVPSVDYPIVTN